MTKIRATRTGVKITIDISGHSEYAVSGQDIVCAGISTLGQTAAVMFAQMEAAGELESFYLEKRSGELHLKAKACKWTKAKARGIYDFFLTGARLIAENYPENAELSCGEKFKENPAII